MHMRLVGNFGHSACFRPCWEDQKHADLDLDIKRVPAGPYMLPCACFQASESLLQQEQPVQLSHEARLVLQSRRQRMSEDSARFYAACVILGLEYMNSKDLMWRYGCSD